jgi:RNA polymerase sigma-70 factor (ECF subfamily)
LSETTRLEAVALELVPRARHGDADALELLLRRCRGTVFRWALVQTGDAADADDVTQEVLIRLHTALPRYAGRSRFTTWLYQVTRHEAASLGRRARRRLRLAGAIERETAGSAIAPDDAVDRLHAAEVAALARGLLRGLPRRQREVFALADLEGCPITEIAERLGTSAVTARVHLFHARRALRAAVLERWPALREEAR